VSGAAAPGEARTTGDRFLGGLIALAIRCAEGVGVEATLRFGEGFGRAWWALRGPRCARVRGQLARAFPERDRDWLDAKARAVFVHLGLGVAEGILLAGRHRTRMLERVDVEGLEHLEAAREGTSAPQGVLVLAPHLGAWELAAAKLAELGLPVSAVYRDPGQPAFERALLRIRGAAVAEIPMGPRAGVHFVRALEEGRTVLALLDQRGKSQESVLTTFFDRPAETRTAPIKLALRAGAPIVCGWAQRAPDRRHHRITIHPALQPAGPAFDDEKVLRRIVQQVTAEFEQAIRATPEQWIWTHRRWRDPPDATVER